MSEIVLTMDRSNMSGFNRSIYLGFLSCLPRNICPQLIYDVLVPQLSVNPDGTVSSPPLPLRAVEAICVQRAGFKPENVKIAHPDYVEKVITENTKLVGVSVHDPLGLGPATTTWSTIFNGIPWNRLEFFKLVNSIKKLKKNFGFKFVIGGSGAWQLRSAQWLEALEIDTLFVGEGERTIPQLFRDIVAGHEPPQIVEGEIPEPAEIPPIMGPTNCRLVEISRGCGRGCKFCAPNTAGRLRSFPLEKIKEEVKMYVRHGIYGMTFQSEDTLRYGSSTILADKDVLLNLYSECFEAGAKRLFITHASLITFAYQPEVIEALTKLLVQKGHKFYGCQPGLETGSPRLLAKHMRGKMLPRSAKEWHEIVIDAFKVMKKNRWYPVCTLISGLPGEEIEDVNATMELIKKLDDFPALYVPLFFVPMSMTALRNRKKFISENMTPAHWALMLVCWDHNLRFFHKIYSITKPDNNPALETVLRILATALRVWIEIKREAVLKAAKMRVKNN